jgi:hypothetical protein
MFFKSTVFMVAGIPQYLNFTFSQICYFYVDHAFCSCGMKVYFVFLAFTLLLDEPPH